MKTLQALRETRASKVDAIKAIHAKATTEKRDMTDAEQSAFDAGRGEIDTLDRDIRNAEFLATVERHEHGEPVTGARGMADLERRFSIGKALGEFAENGRLTGVEAEYAAEHRSGRPNAFAAPVSMFLGERRAILTTAPIAGPGGRLVPTEVAGLIDNLKPTLAVEAAGATVISGLTGNLSLPRVSGSGTAYWVPEHGEPVESDPTFDSINMSPHTVAGLYEVSRRMLIQAPQIETILRTDIGYILRQALDAAALWGGGANQPVGIMATPGIPVMSLGANGGSLSVDTPVDMMGYLETSDAVGDRTAFITNAKVKKTFAKLKDSSGKPYSLGDGADIFRGEPAIFSNIVPSNLTKGTGANLSAIIYGNWVSLVLAYWSNIDIVLNPYADSVAKKGGAYLHAFLDTDVGIRHNESFVVVKDVVTV